jgi:hypothetical protein
VRQRTHASPAHGGTALVAEAGDAVEAAIWVDALHDAGIEAHSFERGVGAALGGATTNWARYPVLVPREALGHARSVIAELAGAAVLAPYRDPDDIRDGQSRALRTAALIAGIVLLAIAAARLLAG